MGYRPPPPPPIPSAYPPEGILLYADNPGLIYRVITWILNLFRKSKRKHDDKVKNDEYAFCTIGDDGEIVYPISDIPKPKQNASYGTVTK